MCIHMYIITIIDIHTYTQFVIARRTGRPTRPEGGAPAEPCPRRARPMIINNINNVNVTT